MGLEWTLEWAWNGPWSGLGMDLGVGLRWVWTDLGVCTGGYVCGDGDLSMVAWTLVWG